MTIAILLFIIVVLETSTYAEGFSLATTFHSLYLREGFTYTPFYIEKLPLKKRRFLKTNSGHPSVAHNLNAFFIFLYLLNAPKLTLLSRLVRDYSNMTF